MTPQIATSIRIDEEILDALRAVQDRDGVSISEQIRRALRAWLDARAPHDEYRLTVTERRILSNQLRLLEHAYPREAKFLQAERYAVERGYPLDYAPEGIDRDELDVATAREVRDILRMFELLQVARKQLKPKGVSAADVAFPGFDGNEEASHFGYCEFLVERRGLWKHVETAHSTLDSHSPELYKYRAMLREFRKLNRNAYLTEYQMRTILAAGADAPYPG